MDANSGYMYEGYQWVAERSAVVENNSEWMEDTSCKVRIDIDRVEGGGVVLTELLMRVFSSRY